MASLSWAVLVTSASSQIHAAETIPTEATALVETMGLIETTRQALEVRIKRRLDRDPEAKEELKCIESVDLSDVGVAFAETFAATMPPALMIDARDFFRTPVGKKYLQYSTSTKLIPHLEPTTVPFEMLTPAENEAVEEFEGTVAGITLMSGILQSSVDRDRIFRRLFPILSSCSPEYSWADHYRLLAPLPPTSESMSEVPAKSTPASLANVRALVREMLADEIFVAIMRSGISNDESMSKEGAACAAKHEASGYTGAIATGIVDELSAGEVEDARTFYRSTAGKKLVQLMLDSLTFVPEPSRMAEVMTPDEFAEMRRFVDSPAGRKTSPDSVMQQSGVRANVQHAFLVYMSKCRWPPTER